MEAVLLEQQRSFMKSKSKTTTRNIGFYILALPADEIASLCVIHMMRRLLTHFIDDTRKDAERSSGVRNIIHEDSNGCKILAI